LCDTEDFDWEFEPFRSILLDVSGDNLLFFGDGSASEGEWRFLYRFSSSDESWRSRCGTDFFLWELDPERSMPLDDWGTDLFNRDDP